MKNCNRLLFCIATVSLNLYGSDKQGLSRTTCMIMASVFSNSLDDYDNYMKELRLSSSSQDYEAYLKSVETTKKIFSHADIDSMIYSPQLKSISQKQSDVVKQETQQSILAQNNYRSRSSIFSCLSSYFSAKVHPEIM